MRKPWILLFAAAASLTACGRRLPPEGEPAIAALHIPVTDREIGRLLPASRAFSRERGLEMRQQTGNFGTIVNLLGDDFAIVAFRTRRSTELSVYAYDYEDPDRPESLTTAREFMAVVQRLFSH